MLLRICEITGNPSPDDLARRISCDELVRWSQYLSGNVEPAEPEIVKLSDEDLFFELARGLGAKIVR